jgi:hypothetical protein
MATTSHLRRAALVAAALAAATLAAVCTGLKADGPSSEELEGRAPTAEELRPSVEAAFPHESYAPGSRATLVLYGRERGLRVRLFRVGPERIHTVGNSEMQGIPVSPETRIPAGVERSSLAIGDWPSGLYFARLTAADGRVGFAPFVVPPRRLGEARVAVVLPTLTWQAYNLRDDDGDGKGDTWYADWKKHTALLGRPYLNRGVPYNFRRYDLPFLHWLSETGRQVDVLSDSDLDAVANGGDLAAAYDLVVFPGHHEYVTTHEYDVVEAYRNRGGNLAFLSANNFFWRIRKHGNEIERTQQWRDLERPEAALIGVEYRGNDRGTHRAPWIVLHAEAASWLFAGTGLKDGSTFGNGGIEIDKTATASPHGVQVLAEIPNLFGPGFTAQMTYYETAAGAKVFAAGAFRLTGSCADPVVAQLLDNLMNRLSRP